MKQVMLQATNMKKTTLVLLSFQVLAVTMPIGDVAPISLDYHLQTLAEASRLYLRIKLLYSLYELTALVFKFIKGSRWIQLNPALGLGEDGIIKRVHVW